VGGEWQRVPPAHFGIFSAKGSNASAGKLAAALCASAERSHSFRLSEIAIG